MEVSLEEAEPQPGGQRPYLDAKVYVYDHPESRHEPGARQSKSLLSCQSSCIHLRQGLLAGALVRAATIKSAAWHCGRNSTCRAGSLATTVALLEQVCVCARASLSFPSPAQLLIQALAANRPRLPVRRLQHFKKSTLAKTAATSR